MGCPGPQAARVLYENANDTSYPYITILNGREYLDRQTGFNKPGPDTTFLDLAAGTLTVLHHAPGTASCFGDPVQCTFTTPDGSSALLTGVTLDAATNVWTAAASQGLPAGYSPLSFKALPSGDIVLFGSGKPDLRAFDRSTGQSEQLLELGGRTPSRILTLPSGPSLVAFNNALKGGAEFSFALSNPAPHGPRSSSSPAPSSPSG